jgi:hypothetical protein
MVVVFSGVYSRAILSHWSLSDLGHRREMVGAKAKWTGIPAVAADGLSQTDS